MGSAEEPFSSLAADPRYFCFLDQFHQRINNNQTKGIPAGTFSSHIAAELCMLAVDHEIRQHIYSLHESVGYIRYVDDLTFFSDSESVLAALYPAIQTILNQYRLRINGNKTETSPSVYSKQPTYLAELEALFPQLKLSGEPYNLKINDYFCLKKYIGECLRGGRSSQIRALLSIVQKRVKDGAIDVSEIAESLFYLLLKLVFEDVTLVAHAYRLIEMLLEGATNRNGLLDAMRRKKKKIDSEYPDTMLQIWHYYVLFKYSDADERAAIISEFKLKSMNPLIAAAFVVPGKNQNRMLFQLIRDRYVQETGSLQWKKEIMYSKWWLPLFKIFRYDEHDYDNFMKSNNFPKIFRYFPRHTGT